MLSGRDRQMDGLPAVKRWCLGRISLEAPCSEPLSSADPRAANAACAAVSAAWVLRSALSISRKFVELRAGGGTSGILICL
mmetsp:Transcript_12202/g.38233  ORF Transcript_12202/g.38233 Transcript_12202/m.38233 type:complete len:81 (-) Transcript_12202:488-730(-)